MQAQPDAAAHRGMRLSAVGVGAAVLVGLVGGPTGAASGHAKVPVLKPSGHKKVESPEQALVRWINAGRSAAGLHSVTISGDLSALAHQHAAHMAKIDRVFHDPSLGSEVHGWRSLAEDVGSAARLTDLENALLTNPADKVNLRSAGFRQLGVGISSRDGLLYVTVIWRQPDGSAHG
jgi:hypothetical protein